VAGAPPRHLAGALARAGAERGGGVRVRGGNWEAAALLAPSRPLALPLLAAERAADPDLARRADAYVVTLLLLALGALAVAAHEWTRARWAAAGAAGEDGAA
jgi:hypothetical protein